MLTLARWNPFDELTPLHREMERVFRRSWVKSPLARVGPGYPRRR